MPFPQPLEPRFWPKVDKRGSDECWVWIANRDGHGYGKISRGAFTADGGASREVFAHRASWAIHYGAIPEGLVVCHKCDNPPCVNPAHLFLGTHQENLKDAGMKYRFAHSSAPGSRERGLALHDQGMSQRQIAALFGVNQSAVWHWLKDAGRTSSRQLRLTRSDALEIRCRHAAGSRQADLAREYGVSTSTVSDIIAGRTWR